MLPKSKQSEFSKICRDLVNERWTISGKSSLHYGLECNENRDGLPTGSPAKKARQCNYKLLGNALKTGISDGQYRREPLTLQQLQVSEGGDPSYERKHPASQRPLPVPYQDENGLLAGATTITQDVPLAREFEKRKNTKVLRMERESNSVNFGFKILGDLFTEREIVVREVDKQSIAERAGLRARDRITRINDMSRERARKSDIVHLIKSENVLKLTVMSTKHFKEAQDIDVEERAVAIETTEVHDYNTKKVAIYTNEDGWMGCSIRGGMDYRCKVHIISVADGSPAESAGLKQGDIITEVNGISLKGCTHVQAVNLILTASPPILFTIEHYDNRHDGGVLQKPESQNANNLPHTPLRINNCRPRRLEQGASDIAPCLSPLPLPPPLPGCWYQNDSPSVGASGVVSSPSALPLNTLHLDGTPPPPYTAEVPQMHKVIQMGGNARENRNNSNHGLLLPMESDMPYQHSSRTLQNEELTTEQSRESERDAVRHSTHKGNDVSSLSKNASCLLDIETSSTGNTYIVLQDAEINDASGNQAESNSEKEGANTKPNSQSSLLEAIRNFNTGSLKTAKEKNTLHTPGKLFPSSKANDSLKADTEHVIRNGSSVSNEYQAVESSEADLRNIINQALKKRRADILDSSQESVNESYCSEWDL
ncbi:uncharacterized protein LOC116304858 [Actinia tenebrosa]|uniref:Uncharacterized protein LOC116304858 n=1 Tax=Actinia tenebrosa TaxID=6105 RepID=A0A6P8IX27_ACTTE|nr:uncharacterized protein LOC116304858 [Actinia tenebrosa]